MKYSSRFFLYAPLIAFLALAGWAMAHWWVVAGALDKKLTALNDHEAVPGITLHYTAKTISGFPFNIDVVFRGLRISGAGAHGPFAWQSERFALHRLTYGRAQDIYEAAGNQALRWTDAQGQSHALNFLPATLHASAITDARGLVRFDLDMLDASGTNQDGNRLTAARVQLHLRRDPKSDMLDLMTSLTAAQAPGTNIRTLSAYASLTHASAFAPLLAGTQSWPEAATAWQQAGGVMQPGHRDVTPAQDAGNVIDAILAPFY
jgi:hypothetical protein